MTEPDGERPVMLVTGGSRGIGAAICRLAAAAGYTVVVNYAASADIAAALADDIGNESFAVQADVADEAAVLAMFTAIDDRCGQIDVLVNNAGIAGSFGTLDTYTVEALDRLWAVNLTGAFICAREAASECVPMVEAVRSSTSPRRRRCSVVPTNGFTTRPRKGRSTP